jgi:hypothetical protein
MTKPIIIKARQAPRAYSLDPEKLKGASQSILPYLLGSNLYYYEDYEYFDLVKPYLDIPEPKKSIEELSQELDEKFEELLVKTKRKFAVSKESAEYHYNQFCKKQDGDFEYAKTQGYFPKVTFISSGKFDCSTLSVNGGVNIGSPSFVVKNGSSHQGYYTIGDGYYRFYMSEKPNMIFRWFVYKLMGFRWVDEDT